MIIARFIITALLFFSCGALFFVCLLAIRKRSTSGFPAILLALAGLFVAIYDIGYAMEINTVDIAETFFWVRFQHWGIQLVTPTWFLFALLIVRKNKTVSPYMVTLIFFPPIIALLASQTLGGLNLLHSNPGLAGGELLSRFVYDKGWAMYLVVIVQSAYLIASIVLLAISFARGFPIPRNQSAIYLLGTALPLVSSLAYNFDITPYNADTTPIVLGLSVLLFMVGFFKVGLLDIVPLARDVIFEGQGDGVLVIDRRGRLTDSNQGMRSILPALENTEPGASARDTFVGHGALEELLDRDPPSAIEYEAGTASGSRIFHVTSAQLHGASGKSLGKLLTFHDVTEMKELQRRLETMATHDELTGLYNRRYLNDFATREIDKARAEGSDFSAIMLDLDYFKKVNDTYGHAAGDLVLVAVAKACQRGLRHDDVIGRFGGEELLVLLPRTPTEAAGFVAEKLRVAIEACQVPYDGLALSVTASFGVASLSPACATLKDLLIAADMALYKAKDSGRNRVCCSAGSDSAGSSTAGGAGVAGTRVAGAMVGSGVASTR